jgi:hypothetical protein
MEASLSQFIHMGLFLSEQTVNLLILLKTK